MERSKPRVGRGGQAGLTELHGNGLLKFQGGTHELFHLTAIILQLVIALAVGQVKFFETGKFNLKFCDLFKREMRESGLRFASEHLANENGEGAMVRKHGTVQNFDGQSVAKLSARDQTIPMAAGMAAPRNECFVLGRSGMMAGDIAVGKHSDNFRVGRRMLDPSVLVTVAEDVCLEFHELVYPFLQP